MNIRYILLLLLSLSGSALVSVAPVTAVLSAIVIASCSAIILITRGGKASIINTAVSLSVSALVYTNIAGLVITVAALACGLLIVVSVKNKLDLQSIMGYSAGGFLLVNALGILGGNLYYQSRVIDNFVNMLFADIKSTYSVLLAESEMNKILNEYGLTVDNFWSTFEYLKAFTIVIVPAILIVASAAVAYFSFCITRKALARRSVFLPVRPFLFLKMSRISGWIFILTWLIPYFVKNLMVTTVLENISAVLMVLFTFCGFSYVCYLFCRKVLSPSKRGLIITLVSVVSVLLSGILANLFLIIGIIDSVWDLRRISVFIKKG